MLPTILRHYTSKEIEHMLQTIIKYEKFMSHPKLHGTKKRQGVGG